MPSDDVPAPTFTTEELTMLRESLAQASVPVGSPAAPVALGLLGKLDGMIVSKNVAEV